METKKTTTALLVMDMMPSILQRMPDSKPFVDGVAKTIALARSRNMHVIYIVVGFRQGMPEVSPNNKSFSLSKEQMAGMDMVQWMKIDPTITPLPDDLVVIKRRISAFTGSDLEVVLRSFGIQHLVLTGISTSGVVLSTVREAADKDYRLTVISDCCIDFDEEVHRVLTTKIFPRQAEVVTLQEWSK